MDQLMVNNMTDKNYNSILASVSVICLPYIKEEKNDAAGKEICEKTKRKKKKKRPRAGSNCQPPD